MNLFGTTSMTALYLSDRARVKEPQYTPRNVRPARQFMRYLVVCLINPARAEVEARASGMEREGMGLVYPIYVMPDEIPDFSTSKHAHRIIKPLCWPCGWDHHAQDGVETWLRLDVNAGPNAVITWAIGLRDAVPRRDQGIQARPLSLRGGLTCPL